MSRTCTICRLPHHLLSDLELALRRRSIRAVAAQYGMSEDSMGRHVKKCLGRLLPDADASDSARAQNILDELADLTAQARAILTKAETSGSAKDALAAIQQVRANLELSARLTGALQTRAKQSNLHLHISAQAAQRVAEVYLQRHGALPAPALDSEETANGKEDQ